MLAAPSEVRPVELMVPLPSMSVASSGVLPAPRPSMSGVLPAKLAGLNFAERPVANSL